MSALGQAWDGASWERSLSQPGADVFLAFSQGTWEKPCDSVVPLCL